MQIIRIACILCILIFSSCDVIKKKDVTVRLGVPPRSGFLPVLLAIEKGFFKENGLDIEVVLDEKVGDLYSERKLDVICTGLTEPILFSSDGHGTQIVYRFSYSLANDVIIARSNIKKLDHLRDKRISFDGVNSSSHIFVQQLLSKKSIFEGEYYAVNIPVNQVLTALEEGKIDAGHTNGISHAEITKKGWNIVGKSSDDPDLLSDTLSVDTKFLENNPLLMEKIISSIVEARNMYMTNQKESIALVADMIGKTPNEIQEELKSVRFLSIKENIQSLKSADSEASNPLSPQGNSIGGGGIPSFSFSPIGDKGGLYIAGETIIQFLRERGQLYRMPKLKFIINDTFVKKQEKNEIIP